MVHASVFLLLAFTHLVYDTNVRIFESMPWNASVHRVDLSLYSRLKKSLGMESDSMLTPREKSPVVDSSKQRQTHDAASHRIVSQTHHRLSCSSPARCYII